jgi:hypothetical protein
LDASLQALVKACLQSREDFAKETLLPDTHNDLRYPIGPMPEPGPVTLQDRLAAVEVIAQTPAHFADAVGGLSAEQIDMPYREGGWTVRQVVHHVGDSHMTAFHRIRRTLTEDVPTLQGYNEKLFANLPDSAGPIEWSLQLLEGVHARWVMMLNGLTEAQWQRKMNHSERGLSTIDQATQLYSWHSQHHLAHIMNLRKAKGW